MGVITHSMAAELIRGTEALGLKLSPQQQEKLLHYLALLEKWNRAYNLSAIRDTQQMVSRHLLDSLSVAPHLADDGQRFIDVGSGGGLPGIPLAIVFPEKSFTLLDSNGKKTRFLFQVKLELGLDNVTVENCRVEAYRPAELYDGVISRAFASLGDMTGCTRHLLTETGRFWAMKGVYPQDELSRLTKHYNVVGCHSLWVPGSDGERHLVVLSALSPAGAKGDSLTIDH